MANKPTGKNINVRCGSQHTEKLAATVTKLGCDIGVAFDGDGDRVIFSDEKGGMVDGDHTLAVLARHFKNARNLKNRCVVITVMANLGLKKFLSAAKIRPIEVSVGDRHVSAAMDKHGAVLGGEQSGHIILGHHLPTGDGLLTSLHVIAAILSAKRTLSALAGSIRKYPQVLLNVKVKDRRPLHNCTDLNKKIQHVESILKSDGRVLVRYSGTEPLLRIMLEGPDKTRLDVYARDIASAVPHHV
jgi:phosphoglucosamine mutase